MATPGNPHPYSAIGTADYRKLAESFYSRVKNDPVLRHFFPGKTLTCAIEEFTAFLVQFLGGPSSDAQRRWWLSLRDSHSRFTIGQTERDAWFRLMAETLTDAGFADDIREELHDFFDSASTYLINQDPPACPHALRNADLELRWQRQRALDDAVAAVKGGDFDRAIQLAGSERLTELFKRNASVFAGFLGLLISAGEPLAAYARKTLSSHPELIHERYNGRTLLHAAAAAGALSTVELLLESGADPNVRDGGRHTPLYSVGNECLAPSGPAVVRVLIKAGADPNLRDGVKRCAPLHMAARRGNVEVATALIEGGADINLRDTGGDTPLKRALNCRKPRVAELLIAAGAVKG